MPPRNNEAMVHYEDTIKKRIQVERIARFISQDLRAKLQSVFGSHSMAVWGSVAGSSNRAKFDKMVEGDDLLIVEGDSIKLIGKIAAKTVSADLSRELWKPLSGGKAKPWELIYFIANPRELHVPFRELCKLFGYSENLQLRGFTTVADDKIRAFYDRYDDLYSILLRLQSGDAIATKQYPPAVQRPSAALAKDSLVEIEPEDVEQVLRSDLVSDHVKMQWKLARLGLKAGEREFGFQSEINRDFAKRINSTSSIRNSRPASTFLIHTSTTSTSYGNRNSESALHMKSKTRLRFIPVY